MEEWQSAQRLWLHCPDCQTEEEDSLVWQMEQERREERVELITDTEFVKSYLSRPDMLREYLKIFIFIKYSNSVLCYKFNSKYNLTNNLTNTSKDKSVGSS